MNKDRYKDFVDRCYAEEKYLTSAMKIEIAKVIRESSTPEEASDIIIELILATKYEW